MFPLTRSEADAMLETSRPNSKVLSRLPERSKRLRKAFISFITSAVFSRCLSNLKILFSQSKLRRLHPSLEETPVETIGNINAVSEEFIAKIKQTIPNKPIKYVVATHCHSDHMGGLRAFISEKSTVLTTPGNKAFYEKFAPGLKVETFDKKQTISDGERTVELINVGANPHTEENIVVYFPKEKYLFQGDLFYFNNEATFPLKDRLPVMFFFAGWLRKNNLSPVRIYGFHSTMFGSTEHIEKLLEMNSKSKK